MTLPILKFVGDSHFRPTRWASENGLFEPYKCDFKMVGGATAIGLRHPTSKTEALKVFRSALFPFAPDVIPIFQLGEVDCGFVIWLRSQRYRESIQDQLNQSLDAYMRFLIEVRDGGYSNLVVSSAMLPTIKDGQLDGQVAAIRREVEATQEERTDMTLIYNRRLSDLCRSEGLRFLDFTPDLLDPATRLIRESYRNEQIDDHHLHTERTGKLWVRRVLEKIEA
jgi:hypothetical protein